MQLQFQVGIDPPDRIFFGDVHSGSSCLESFIQYVIHIFAAYLAPPRVSVEDEYHSCILRIKTPIKKDTPLRLPVKVLCAFSCPVVKTDQSLR